MAEWRELPLLLTLAEAADALRISGDGVLMEPNRSLLWAIEAIRREERERCAEVAAEVVKAWPASTSAQPELRKLAREIRQRILQPFVADHALEKHND